MWMIVAGITSSAPGTVMIVSWFHNHACSTIRRFSPCEASSSSSHMKNRSSLAGAEPFKSCRLIFHS